MKKLKSRPYFTMNKIYQDSINLLITHFLGLYNDS